MPDDNKTLPPPEPTDAELRGVKAWSVIKKIGTYAAIGAAVIGGVGLIAPYMLSLAGVQAGASAAGIWGLLAAPVAWLFPETAKHVAVKGLETVGAWALNWGATGALIGAAGAGLVGLFSGLSSMDAKAEDYKDELAANYTAAIQRQRQLAVLMQQKQQLGVSMREMEAANGLPNLPNLNIGRNGKGAEIG